MRARVEKGPSWAGTRSILIFCIYCFCTHHSFISTSAHPHHNSSMSLCFSQNYHLHLTTSLFSPYYVSDASGYDFLFIHFYCPHCHTSPPLLLSTISYQFPCLSFPTSYISDVAVFIILLCLFWSPHHTILYYPCALYQKLPSMVLHYILLSLLCAD